MRIHQHRAARHWALLAAAAATVGAGCSSGEQTAPATDTAGSTVTAPTSEPPPLPAQAVPPGAVAVSPGGVTTGVDVPADATESQYGQACHAAKLWMDTQPGDPVALVEPYLRILQGPAPVGPGTFNSPWADLTPAQQAGVIMAVNGAATGQCE
ncbi:lipoprotein LpqV [Mycolicibacterium palauense]|uniref:lipoprotein LpqV n=1 Tax=Mycolicibacterium palauense TaxID=2034511 RepID=UPI00159BB481|nr:lipoprotein LpqV [Mycolicibacterium palauense]